MLEACAQRSTFCHAVPAATSRYILEIDGDSEEQRSSGVWVGTAAGSTGALRSAGGDVLPFSSTQIELVVREPYSVSGQGQAIAIQSKMRDGRLFVDGPYGCFNVGLGQVARFAVSDEPLTLLGLQDQVRPTA